MEAQEVIPEYIKVVDWDKSTLPGEWVVSYKVNGVRALRSGRGFVSRKGKPLYGMDHLVGKFTDAEIYCGSFEATTSVVRSHNGRPVSLKEIFSLKPLDVRLFMGTVTDPNPDLILRLTTHAVNLGYEGVVLRRGTTWIRSKELRTYDVVVHGVQPGKGKHAGRMGALITDMGKVGGGFDDREREVMNNSSIIGQCIEVACQHLTPAGKFRHARFIRLRPDK